MKNEDWRVDWPLANPYVDHTWHYHAAVYISKTDSTDNYDTYTVAKTLREANRNIVYQYKKEHGLDVHARVTLIGTPEIVKSLTTKKRVKKEQLNKDIDGNELKEATQLKMNI